MIRPAARDELAVIRELVARANDAPYDFAAVAEEKCFGDGIAGAPSTRVFERDGRIAGVAVTCGKWLRVLAVDRDARRHGIGTALLADSDASVIAAEPGNYFTPGVWMEDEGTCAFFRSRGLLEKSTTWNLLCLGRPGTSYDVVRRPTTQESLRDFVQKEFGRAWAFEVARARGAFITEENGNITGFAVYEANNRGLGTFGPAGVVKSHRGRGLGCQLILASLAALRDLGYTRVIIPWTEALDFYRNCAGAIPTHRFVAFARAQP